MFLERPSLSSNSQCLESEKNSPRSPKSVVPHLCEEGCEKMPNIKSDQGYNILFTLCLFSVDCYTYDTYKILFTFIDIL